MVSALLPRKHRSHFTQTYEAGHPSLPSPDPDTRSPGRRGRKWGISITLSKGSDSGMTRGGMIEKVPATAGSRLISIYSAEDGPLAQAANPGDGIEIIAQLLPVQGPCCPANPQAHDQHSGLFSLKTQSDSAFPSSGL